MSSDGPKSVSIHVLEFDGLAKLTARERESLQSAITRAYKASRYTADCYEVRFEVKTLVHRSGVVHR